MAKKQPKKSAKSSTRNTIQSTVSEASKRPQKKTTQRSKQKSDQSTQTSIDPVGSPQHLFRLPLVVRQRIYRLVFPNSTFRSQMQKIFLIYGPQSYPKSLLSTCRAIREDASPSFYGKACFHYSLVSILPMTLETSNLRLPILMHLSLDLSCWDLGEELQRVWMEAVSDLDRRCAEKQKLRQAGESGNNDDDQDGDTVQVLIPEYADKHMAACVNTVAANCPFLRTFALHLLSSVDAFYHVTHDFCQYAIGEGSPYSRPNYTAEALKRLKVRDAVSIIAVGREEDCNSIRSAVGPLGDWQCWQLKKWPGIFINEAEIKSLTYIFDRDDDLDVSIRLWYYQPPGSKELRLPEYQIAKRNGYHGCEYMNPETCDGDTEAESEECEGKGDDAEMDQNVAITSSRGICAQITKI